MLRYNAYCVCPSIPLICQGRGDTGANPIHFGREVGYTQARSPIYNQG